MTRKLETNEIEQAREAVDDLLAAIETFREAIRTGPVYGALRYGNLELPEGMDGIPYVCRNLIADLEGKDHGWSGDAATIDALAALRGWLDPEDVALCVYCGEIGDEVEFGPLGSGPEGDLHEDCWETIQSATAARDLRDVLASDAADARSARMEDAR